MELKMLLSECKCKSNNSNFNKVFNKEIKILDNIIDQNINLIINNNVNNSSNNMISNINSQVINKVSTISLNFDSIKFMTYEEAVNYFNKADLNIIDNEYMKVNIDKSELERLNTHFKYLIDKNNITERELNLGYKQNGDDMIKIFTLCTNLKNLTLLDLNNNNISDKGIEYFSKCDFLKNITTS